MPPREFGNTVDAVEREHHGVELAVAELTEVGRVAVAEFEMRKAALAGRDHALGVVYPDVSARELRHSGAVRPPPTPMSRMAIPDFSQ